MRTYDITFTFKGALRVARVSVISDVNPFQYQIQSANEKCFTLIGNATWHFHRTMVPSELGPPFEFDRVMNGSVQVKPSLLTHCIWQTLRKYELSAGILL